MAKEREERPEREAPEPGKEPHASQGRPGRRRRTSGPARREVRGVVGVLAGEDSAPALLEALARAAQAGESGGAGRAGAPDAVEVRADLFESPAEALALVERTAALCPVIFTARLPGHGGRFTASEADRVRLYRAALASGAALVDAEVGSGAAIELARERAPLIVSHHDFEGSPDAIELARITREMEALSPRVLKLVPTASRLADGVRILEWVAARPAGGPLRVGFAMAQAGVPSRVLTLAWGAPWTYGAWDAQVAPGLPSVGDLQRLYRARQLRRDWRIFGVAGNPVGHSLSPHLHNPALAARGIRAVYLPLLLETLSELPDLVGRLPIDGVSVTIPFKEAARELATERDARVEASGAANTLLVTRSDAGTPAAFRAYNTDFEGVLGPLRRRGIALSGTPVAIVGNGGAARGAVTALQEAGARPTLFVRSLERGRPVAEALGVPVEPLERLMDRRGVYRVILNATPLGMKARDPSPVPPGALDAGTVAFDMVYGRGTTPFLEAAALAGAQAISGLEMLVAQALEQFRLFTGQEATAEELERSLLAAIAARG